MCDTMRYWLGTVCREARAEHPEVLQVDIATQTRNEQSTIARFERNEGSPRDLDLVVAAYAHELGIEPRAIWAEALQRWHEAGDQADVFELRKRAQEQKAQRKADREKRQAPTEERVEELDALALEPPKPGRSRRAAPRKRSRGQEPG